ncbi:hypothetical protein G6546_20160 [Citrobacter portucalensis]|uniref:hypothetical protein n=1 Tax=Citrobacter portucalensis TaxID=1639133 RepID=UPI00140FE880|nr:hypothetical protein [Citrobacter portucalensis]NHR83136.1 hypothetical protein [Citrobacter portucalensis]
MNATEKDNVFYCDCGFSWRRDMSGSHNCEDGLRAKLTDMAVQLANAESKCRELAAELSAVDKIHNEAVFITDDHYEQCPPEVQKMIRSLAVLQIPACDAFLAEVRAQGVEMFGEHVKEYNHSAEWQSKHFAAQLRKGAAL